MARQMNLKIFLLALKQISLRLQRKLILLQLSKLPNLFLSQTASTTSVEDFADADELVEFSSTSTDNADDDFYYLSDTQDAEIPVSKEDKIY